MRKKEKTMTKEKIREIREIKGFTIERMAQEFSISEKTWRRWEKGESKPLPAFEKKLENMAKKEGIK